MSSARLLVALVLPISIGAQESAEAPGRAAPFVVGAAHAGPLGFTQGVGAAALLGAYAYAAFPRAIFGLQLGGSIRGSMHSHLRYGMATFGYPARAVRASLMYPYIGVGAGVLDAGLDTDHSGAIFGAGVGVDRVVGNGNPGMLVGLRGGYIYRPTDVGDRAIYVSVSLGAGGRRTKTSPPPRVIATRDAQ